MSATDSINLVKPLCRSLAEAEKTELESINYLKNTSASHSLGQKREEDWRE